MALIPVCPKCDKPMVTLEWQETEIDLCLQCRGIWFDAGELESIAGQTEEQKDWFRDLSDAPSLRVEAGVKRLCPRCNRPLISFAVKGAEDTVLTLDRCEHGHGYWFDGGELASYLKGHTVDNQNASERLKTFLREIMGE